VSTFLFDSIIFGPVWSRRLGESLGINLLPVNRKICSFNCIYCECGLTPKNSPLSEFPSRQQVKEMLKSRLDEMKKRGDYLDSITFAGNGEPTLHPEFSGIIEDTLGIRDLHFPEAKITVLSNATMAGNKVIFDALLKTDMNVLKLDSAMEETLMHMNCPRGKFRLADLISSLMQFRGKLIVQTLFLRGNYSGIAVDNCTESEVSAWLKVLAELNPECVMIYSIARDTAIPGLERVGVEELTSIAARVEKLGIPIQVTP
jgi:wyosine [tRNA(Phe)-imidazoG37] synthetase (radical SAM superfamily)